MSLMEWRDQVLDMMRAKGWSPSYEAILGARIIRQVAFMSWCPPCQDGDHRNHDAAQHPSRPKPVPVEGGCWSLGNGELCDCLWRVDGNG